MVRPGEILLLLLIIASVCHGQGQKRKRKPGPADSTDGYKAVTVNYPLSIFATDSADKDWRDAAVFDAELKKESDSEKHYVQIARAQDHEDVWLYENWFYGMKEGVIMESGALNGLLFSTSYMFETFANWTAIHVEADLENYSNLKVNRENSININAALCSSPMLLHYSSYGVIPVRGFIEFMSESFLKKWHGPIYNKKVSIDSLPTVQCTPVKTILRELSVRHIDIWILDIEGAEESALKGTDFSKVQINAVAMECDEHDNAKNERKTSILEANGFKCFLVERNCMCKHNSYKPSTAPELSTLKKWDGNSWKGTYKAPAAKLDE